MIREYEIKAVDCIVCLPGTGTLRAVAETDCDLSELLPYVNGFVKGARYLPRSSWLRFQFRGFPERAGASWQIALKGSEIIAAKFSSRDEAVDAMCELVAFLNHIDASRDAITPSTKAWAPPKVIEICRFLPMTNCGRCGERSCMAFAARLSDGTAQPDGCPDLADDGRARLADLLGL